MAAKQKPRKGPNGAPNYTEIAIRLIKKHGNIPAGEIVEKNQDEFPDLREHHIYSGTTKLCKQYGVSTRKEALDAWKKEKSINRKRKKSLKKAREAKAQKAEARKNGNHEDKPVEAVEIVDATDAPAGATMLEIPSDFDAVTELMAAAKLTTDPLMRLGLVAQATALIKREFTFAMSQVSVDEFVDAAAKAAQTMVAGATE